ncbi:DNA-binding protein [Colwellia sp. Arc7-D]|uniref:DNA-binding protein n=1 Tax=Colwellia sp. Arc7-D TaxID=2161872 RepID=UPI000D37A454|nr:DNA-binding protein [Colwellia sp. Arc7-D]AWB57843.1 hypothetical protein DBO93_09850 [Colwellia sp. Arc7-D]
MARHAEISKEEIIKAGVAIENAGKRPNSGAIRVQLGNRGGFARIKEVWESYANERSSESLSNDNETDIELPTEIQENLDINVKRAIKNLKDITINSYKVAQRLAEKRVSSTIEEYKSKIESFEESEQQAGIALEACDDKIADLYDELEQLQTKNEKLLSDNSHFSGQIESAMKRITDLEKKENEFFELKEQYGKLLGKYEILASK